MNHFATLSTTLICALFLIAGLSKIGRHEATVTAARAFGLPAWPATIVGKTLPYIELAIVGLLFIPGLATYGAAIAALALTAFTAAMIATLLRGQNPPCNCFGQTSNVPISWGTVARNIGILTLVVWVLTAGNNQLNLGLLALWMSFLADLSVSSATVIALASIVGIQAWLISKLMNQQGRMILRLDNLDQQLAAVGLGPVSATAAQSIFNAGDPAPIFVLKDAGRDQEPQLSDYLSQGTDATLLFVSKDCRPCHALLKTLSQERPLTRLLVVANGYFDARESLFADFPELDFVFPFDASANEKYGVVGTPSAIYISNGVVESQMMMGSVAILELLRHSGVRENGQLKSADLLFSQ